MNHKKVWRLYKLHDIPVASVERQRGHCPSAPLQAMRHLNDSWSVDFVMDALSTARRIKCLTILDDSSRECVDIAVDYGISGKYVTGILDRAGQFRGYPPAIRTEQGRSHEPSLHDLGEPQGHRAPDQ